MPHFFDHKGEPDWVSYDDQEDSMDENVEDLLLNVERDLTDDELAQIFS